MIEADRVLRLDSGRNVAGRSTRILAQGIGDATPVEAERTVDGRAMLPLSPVHLCCAGDEDGGLTFRWIRRSRIGWEWRDGTDAPLSEESEAYAIALWASDDLVRSDDVSSPEWTYEAAAIAVDLAQGGAPLSFTVRQRGTFGTGPAARIVLCL